MGSIKCVRHLNPKFEYSVEVKRLVSDQRRQGLTLQQFHRNKVLSVVLADLVNSANIGVAKRRGEPRFATKSFQNVGITRERFGQKFQGDKTAQGGVLCLVNHTHTTSPEHLEDF